MENSSEFAVVAKDVAGQDQEVARCTFKCQADLVAVALQSMFPSVGFESKIVFARGREQ